MNQFDPASASQLAVRHRPGVGKVLKEQFADGKWRRVSKYRSQIDHDEDRVCQRSTKCRKIRPTAARPKRKRPASTSSIEFLD